jgi:hypothetical protein
MGVEPKKILSVQTEDCMVKDALSHYLNVD